MPSIIQEDTGLTHTGTVTVTVSPAAPANRAPNARDDAYESRNGESLILDVLVNDSDPDGDPISIVGLRDLPPGVRAVRYCLTGCQATPR